MKNGKDEDENENEDQNHQRRIWQRESDSKPPI
jgi:hypothetical protein